MHKKPNTPKIENMADVVSLFEKNVVLASILKVGASTVSEMKRRKNIPPEYWPAIVNAAHARGRTDITFEKLVELRRKFVSKRGKAA